MVKCLKGKSEAGKKDATVSCAKCGALATDEQHVCKPQKRTSGNKAASMPVAEAKADAPEDKKSSQKLRKALKKVKEAEKELKKLEKEVEKARARVEKARAKAREKAAAAPA